jgi:hypothetical protein
MRDSVRFEQGVVVHGAEGAEVERAAHLRVPSGRRRGVIVGVVRRVRRGGGGLRVGVVGGGGGQGRRGEDLVHRGAHGLHDLRRERVEANHALSQLQSRLGAGGGEGGQQGRR